jgi:TPR repeat protein
MKNLHIILLFSSISPLYSQIDTNDKDWAFKEQERQHELKRARMAGERGEMYKPSSQIDMNDRNWAFKEQQRQYELKRARADGERRRNQETRYEELETSQRLERQNVEIQKHQEEARLLLIEAKNGNVIAQRLIGISYILGEGVAKNEKEAGKWFYKAAEQGDADSQCMLGYIYLSSELLKNDMLAYKWMLVAAANGVSEAKEEIPKIEARLTNEQRSKGRLLATEWQTAFGKQ